MKLSRSWLIEVDVPATKFRTRFHVVAPSVEKALAVARHGFPGGGWQPQAHEPAYPAGYDLAAEFRVVGEPHPVYIEH